MEDITANTKKQMQAAIEHLRQELRSIRAGRANSAIIEGVSVEVYGTNVKLKELGTITVPETRQLLVIPFDGSTAPAILKALDSANLGVRTSLEGKQQIRVFFPVLDEARRKELVVQVHEKREKCKISLRDIRRHANESIKTLKATMSEDEIKRLEQTIQTLTDQSCKEADTVALEKEKEVSTV